MKPFNGRQLLPTCHLSTTIFSRSPPATYSISPLVRTAGVAHGGGCWTWLSAFSSRCNKRAPFWFGRPARNAAIARQRIGGTNARVWCAPYRTATLPGRGLPARCRNNASLLRWTFTIPVLPVLLPPISPPPLVCLPPPLTPPVPPTLLLAPLLFVLEGPLAVAGEERRREERESRVPVTPDHFLPGIALHRGLESRCAATSETFPFSREHSGGLNFCFCGIMEAATGLQANSASAALFAFCQYFGQAFRQEPSPHPVRPAPGAGAGSALDSSD